MNTEFKLFRVDVNISQPQRTFKDSFILCSLLLQYTTNNEQRNILKIFALSEYENIRIRFAFLIFKIGCFQTENEFKRETKHFAKKENEKEIIFFV